MNGNILKALIISLLIFSQLEEIQVKHNNNQVASLVLIMHNKTSYNEFKECMRGPNLVPWMEFNIKIDPEEHYTQVRYSECERFDLDFDGDIDMKDFSRFQQIFFKAKKDDPS